MLLTEHRNTSKSKLSHFIISSFLSSFHLVTAFLAFVCSSHMPIQITPYSKVHPTTLLPTNIRSLSSMDSNMHDITRTAVEQSIAVLAYPFPWATIRCGRARRFSSTDPGVNIQASLRWKCRERRNSLTHVHWPAQVAVVAAVAVVFR